MRFIYKGSQFKQSGTTMQKHVPPSERARRARVRRVYPGFPANPFRTREEVDAYVSDDVICCLLCGRHLKALAAHLKFVHGTDASDYRARFNIPWNVSLIGERLRELKQKTGYQRGNKEYSKRKTLGTGHRPPCDLGLEAINEANPRRGKDGGFLFKDFSWHLEQIRTTYGVPDPPPGMASWNTFKRRRMVDPELYAAYKAAKASRPVDPRTARRRNKAP